MRPPLFESVPEVLGQCPLARTARPECCCARDWQPQNPLILDDSSEPRPDLLILRPRADFYRGGHPTPDDVRLVIEVADTSEDFDRRAKLPRYAQAGIPEAWLIVLSADAVDVYNDPSPDGYRAHRRFGFGERVTSRQFPALNVAVSELV